ncbi:galactitol-1-phosphate 5-dehydrogenase [Ectobacillus funiculus]|uniref:Galactitol-1-phosphate 5-dehydrogenase n=1 Tax=Ectobacillus funiculus TaxID=137993 RepID=A0ABV5WGZ5_9BACI
MSKMKALVVYGKEDVRLKDVDIPAYAENEVLVKVKACGICGSDLPRALDGKVHSYPIILGHEFSGVVEEVGSAVEHFQKGDRVAVAPLLPCGHCEYCKTGKPAMCEEYSFLGSRQHGAMAEYVPVKAENLVKVPDEVDFLSAALIEPITVALHGIDRVTLQSGATAVVFGAGTIGLLTLQCLKARGLGKVYVVDIVDEKLKVAKQMGADEIINAKNVDVLAYLAEHGKPEYAFETAGTPITQMQSIEAVKKLGKVVFVGTATRDFTLPPKSFEKILRGELEVTGSWMSYSAPFPGYEWTAALQYIKEKKINTELFLTHICRLEEGINAFYTLRNPEANSIKVMFEL